MTKMDIVNGVTRAFHKGVFQLKKHSPEILVGAGVVGVVTSAVLACRATTKLSAVLEENKKNVDQLHEYVEENGYSEKYTEEDGKKDLVIMYTQTGLKIVKLYGPSVLLGAASIACILAGHNITRKRNVALAAAYAAVDKGFKEYRNRVVDRFGEALDRELKYDIKTKEVERTVVAEDGTETTITETVNVVDPNTHSVYARFFDEYCSGWDKNPEYNLMFLRQQQSYANDLLKSRGYLYLNEVYEMLGMELSHAGHVVGWIYDEVNPVGDNFVDFGIYDPNNERKRLFVNGKERSILLDFNVDGNVWELMA